MNWTKEMLVGYDLPFAHDAYIQCEIKGEVKDILLCRVYMVSPEATTPEDKFSVFYKDSLGNRYDARELIKGFIKILPKPDFITQNIKPFG